MKDFFLIYYPLFVYLGTGFIAYGMINHYLYHYRYSFSKPNKNCDRLFSAMISFAGPLALIIVVIRSYQDRTFGWRL